jgi:hypothetical protein
MPTDGTTEGYVASLKIACGGKNKRWRPFWEDSYSCVEFSLWFSQEACIDVLHNGLVINLCTLIFMWCVVWLCVFIRETFCTRCPLIQGLSRWYRDSDFLWKSGVLHPPFLYISISKFCQNISIPRDMTKLNRVGGWVVGGWVRVGE